MSTETPDTSEAIKEKGNECVKNEKYLEAILHYTHALKLDESNFSLYSNRSFAFLKVQQYYLALEDAEETIKRAPQWAKGYFRRGEVQFATYSFSEAILSYGRALQLQPGDALLLDSLSKAAKQAQKEQKADMQIPWVGAGVGIVVGVMIVLADYLFTKKPTLAHPILMILMTMAIAMIGFAIAKGCRYYVKCQRCNLIQPPIDLLGDSGGGEGDTGGNEDVPERSNQRFSKAQARQRFKKGKL